MYPRCDASLRRKVTAAKAAFLALLGVLAVAGCGRASIRQNGAIQSTPSSHARIPGGAPAHVAVIVMENEEYGGIIDSAATPYINTLARRYALATAAYAIRHPSLPNYLALTGGSTFGIDSDCADCSIGARSLVDQLDRRGISWKAYIEDLPAPCFTGAGAGEYAKKHNPFFYYTDVTDHPERCARVVSLDQLASDERVHALPRFIWITPNLCHDMHDCDPATGDRFLAALLPGLLSALGHNGLVFLTWDEGSTDAGCCRLASGGHIVTIVAGPGARPGARMGMPTDHYSLLQTVEDLLGVPRLRGAACPCTPSLRPLLRSRR